MSATVEWVEAAASTNSLVGPDTPHGHCIAAVNQTAGRGQRGNSWESEAGKNLTFSLCLSAPGVYRGEEQFEISMAVAMAVCDFLRRLVDTPEWLRLKWPNDIYFGDRKLGGILIENTLSRGFIERSTAGIGINVNQAIFRSDAPNPISLLHVIGHEMDLKPLMQELADAIVDRFDNYRADGSDVRSRVDCYMSHLWRNEGIHTFRATATGELFEASVHDVKPSGCLVLLDRRGNLREYWFKEVEWL